MIGLGIVMSILTALATVFFYAATPFIFVGFFALSIITYPITLCLRSCGYTSRSFYDFGLGVWSRWNQYQTGRKATTTYTQTEQPKQEQTCQRPQEPEKTSFDPWKVLGVQRGISKDAVTAAYRIKMMTNHPDKVASLDPELQNYATNRTVLIKQAYEQIMKA